MAAKTHKLDNAAYEAELLRLQTELVTMQEWVRESGTRLVVVFEGRDAAGKGGAIKRVTEYLNPRIARIVALPAPTERQRSQWYFQRYTEHLPAAGEIVLLDRSWYNRAGVERVMGFCSDAEYERFLRQCPVFERLLVEDGVLLRKYWFSVSDAEQLKRFKGRMSDPLVQWKLSPMDLQSLTRWEQYSRAKDQMFAHTDTAESPWFDVEAEDKKRARINMLAHLLSTVPYEPVSRPAMTLPERPPSQGYERPARENFSFVPDHAASLEQAEKDSKMSAAPNKSGKKSGKSKKEKKAAKAEALSAKKAKTDSKAAKTSGTSGDVPPDTAPASPAAGQPAKQPAARRTSTAAPKDPSPAQKQTAPVRKRTPAARKQPSPATPATATTPATAGTTVTAATPASRRAASAKKAAPTGTTAPAGGRRPRKQAAGEQR